MTDPRHDALFRVLKTLPSDFEPWGERSRDQDWGPDCSCGCRWFVPLERGLSFDWGVCHNRQSPRQGLLTFEHQGCRQYEDDADLDVAGPPERRTEGQPPRTDEVRLIENLRRRGERLQKVLAEYSAHWGYEDPIYRFYHQSFKIYALQQQTEAIVRELSALVPGRALDPWFLDIVASGTGREFTPEDNRNWTGITRPIVEAFFHARFFLEMTVRYTHLESPPNPLPSGYAALLCLYRLR